MEKIFSKKNIISVLIVFGLVILCDLLILELFSLLSFWELPLSKFVGDIAFGLGHLFDLAIFFLIIWLIRRNWLKASIEMKSALYVLPLQVFYVIAPFVFAFLLSVFDKENPSNLVSDTIFILLQLTVPAAVVMITVRKKLPWQYVAAAIIGFLPIAYISFFGQMG